MQLKRGGRWRAPGAALALLVGLLLAGPAASAQGRRPAAPPTPSPTPSPSPTPAPTPISVEFQAVPLVESAQPGQEVSVFVFVANKSGEPLRALSVDVPGGAFEVVRPPDFAEGVPPLGSVRRELVIRPTDRADYTTHKILLALNYTWAARGREVVSAQPATVTLRVSRRYEDEAKGFPGGSAAFFYLLLPVIPAILGYRWVEERRKTGEWKAPSFGSGDIVPAFFVATLLNVLMVGLTVFGWEVNYANPFVFLSVIVLSFLAGAARPLIRWEQARRYFRQWGLTAGDSKEAYLRKALLAPHRRGAFEWVEATAGGVEWQGILLPQPDGSPALGARLEVTPDADAADARRRETWATLTARVLKEDGTVLDPAGLLAMVGDGSLKVDYQARLQRGGQPQNSATAVGLKGLQVTASTPAPLVVPVF